MAAINSNGGDRWNILGFNFTKRDALSSVYIRYLCAPPLGKVSMIDQSENVTFFGFLGSTLRKKVFL